MLLHERLCKAKTPEAFADRRGVGKSNRKPQPLERLNDVAILAPIWVASSAAAFI
jgi:hypothetical protein